MDVVPGGYTTSWNELNNSILAVDRGGVHWEPRTNIKVHSFIPSFSALGMKQPDQDWSLPLNNRKFELHRGKPLLIAILATM